MKNNKHRKHFCHKSTLAYEVDKLIKEMSKSLHELMALCMMCFSASVFGNCCSLYTSQQGGEKEVK